jgi:hypothetical protein
MPAISRTAHAVSVSETTYQFAGQKAAARAA